MLPLCESTARVVDFVAGIIMQSTHTLSACARVLALLKYVERRRRVALAAHTIVCRQHQSTAGGALNILFTRHFRHNIIIPRKRQVHV